MLTLQKLKDMKPHEIIDMGNVVNSPEGVFITDTDKGRLMTWVAKRGEIFDWAIYIHWADKSVNWVLQHGDKVKDPSNIKKLVPCDEEALKMYRL